MQLFARSTCYVFSCVLLLWCNKKKRFEKNKTARRVFFIESTINGKADTSTKKTMSQQINYWKRGFGFVKLAKLFLSVGISWYRRIWKAEACWGHLDVCVCVCVFASMVWQKDVKNLHKKLAWQDGNDKTICGHNPIKFTGVFCPVFLIGFNAYFIWAHKAHICGIIFSTSCFCFDTTGFQPGFSQQTGTRFKNPPPNKSLNSKMKNDAPFRISFQSPDLGSKMVR